MKYKYPVISLLRSILVGLDIFHKKKISFEPVRLKLAR